MLEDQVHIQRGVDKGRGKHDQQNRTETPTERPEQCGELGVQKPQALRQSGLLGVRPSAAAPLSRHARAISVERAEPVPQVVQAKARRDHDHEHDDVRGMEQDDRLHKPHERNAVKQFVVQLTSREVREKRADDAAPTPFAQRAQTDRGQQRTEQVQFPVELDDAVHEPAV